MGTYWSWSLLRKGRSCYTLDKEWNTRKEKKLFVSSRIYRWAAWKAFSGRQKEKKKTRPWPIPHFHGHQTLPMWILRVRREPVIIRSKKTRWVVLTSKQQLAQSAEFRLPQGKTLLVLLSLQDTREPSQLPSSRQRERVERFQTKARSTGNILSWTVFINPPEAGRHSHRMGFMVMTMSSSFRRISSFMSSTFSRTCNHRRFLSYNG